MPDIFIVLIAKYLFLLIPVLGLVYFLKLSRTRQKELFLFGLVNLPLAFLLAQLAARLYYDPRPFVAGHFQPLIPHDNDNGFPSDHALLSGALAMSLYWFDRRLGISCLLLALLVGWARVAAGVHHPIDILASLALAALAAWLVEQFVRPRLQKFISK